MKKVVSIVVMLAVLFAGFASGTKETVKGETPVQAAIRDAATLNWDQLLAKAKAEIGDNELLVMGSTSRFDDQSFTDRTGIKVKATNNGSSEIFEKVSAEIGAGLYSTDIVASVDSYNFNYAWLNGWLENYVPNEFSSRISEEDQNPLVLLYYNRLFMYNNSKGALQNYIKNVWQFAEPEMKGFEIKNPLLETNTMNFLITLTKEENQKILADAYKSFYGKEWKNTGEYTNIAYAWVHKFLQNAVFNNSDGTIVKNLAKSKPGATGVAVYSKLRSGDVSSIGVSAFEETEGFAGFLFPLYAGVTATAKYPYTACLYINYCLGEEGFMNIFGKDMGGYSSNRDVTISKNAKESGDQELPFWRECLIAEDMDYVTSVYAQAFTLFSQWCADK